MAVSNTQKTRIGTGQAVGIKVDITAKAASGAPTVNVLHFGRGHMRAMNRGIKR